MSTRLDWRILVVLAVAAWTPTAAHAQTAAPDDFQVVLADPATDPAPVLASSVAQANATFDRRATRVLRFVACRPEASNPAQGEYTGALNSDFANNLENWGDDALGKLAYTQGCGSQTAAERYQIIDGLLANLSVPSDLFNGTTIEPPENFSGIQIGRHGDLDTGLKELIPILYLYQNDSLRLPTAFPSLLQFVFNLAGGSNPIPGNPPEIAFSLDGVGTAFSPETENHCLLELSNQYLINQLENQTNSATVVDNSAVHQYLIYFLHGILTSDFFEYNARPYQHYALWAAENLADFAGDDDVRSAAQMVLDWAAAKFVASSSLLRRSDPFRRRGDHDTDFMVGDFADEETCHFALYSGLLPAMFDNTNNVYAADGFCTPVREAISTYRVPDVILDNLFNTGKQFFQIFSGGPSYFANLYANTPGGGAVGGSVEVYDNEGPFLITGGGLPEPNGLPLVITGAIVDAIIDLTSLGSTIDYSTSVSADFGVTQPTLLIPNDAFPGGLPVVDRTNLVRIQGAGLLDANICVAPGFACGKNPMMPADVSVLMQPPGVVTSGPWQFAIVPSLPEAVYVAELTVNVNQPYTVGLFEAEPSSLFPTGQAGFALFQAQVLANNPLGSGLITAFPQGWQGHYVKTDGEAFDFVISSASALGLSSTATGGPGGVFGSYPVTSSNVTLPATNPTTWAFADGEMIQANSTGLIKIIDLTTQASCFLDIQNPAQPTATGCGVSCSPTCSNGFPCAVDSDCLSANCVQGVCQRPSCAPTCTTGGICGSNLDCASGLCTAGQCQADGLDLSVCATNADCNSSVCGSDGVCAPSSCAPTCNQGAPCGSGLDCGSGVCTGGTCRPPACSPQCGQGAVCGNNADCESFVCNSNICAPPGCSPTCERGAPCGSNNDCGSQVCVSGLCQAPACSPNCVNGETCGANNDCSSLICAGNVCQPSACSPQCAAGAPCGANSDCASQVCTNGLCAGASGAGSSASSGGSSATAPACSPKCANGQPCETNGDCESFVCTDGLCAAPTCSPNCNQGAPCGSNADCGSQVCTAGVCAAPACSPNCSSGSACNNNGDCSSHECTNDRCQ